VFNRLSFPRKWESIFILITGFNMSSADKFITELTEGYSFKGDSLIIGTAIYNNEPQQNLHIKIPLSTINRHGLIAGATGTGNKNCSVICRIFV